jgi:hypothetical protein
MRPRNHPAGNRRQLSCEAGILERCARSIRALSGEPTRFVEAVDRGVGRLSRGGVFAGSLAEVG